MQYNLNDIIDLLPKNSIILGNKDKAIFQRFSSYNESEFDSIIWLSSKRKEIKKYLDQIKASLIICDDQTFFDLIPNSCFVIVDNPKLIYSKILNKLLNKNNISKIMDSSIISNLAILHSSVTINEFAVIGECEIGENSQIGAFTKIHDNVKIGKNVVIHSHCNIGSDGFGFVRDENNDLVKMIHIGSVIIEDNVEIYPYTNVDRATLSNTIIRKGVKIDHYCHIGHNSIIGNNSLITAKVVLCGGAQIGENTWIGVGSIIKEKVKIGNNVTIGLGSVVTKDVPDHETWLGSPAVNIDVFKKNQNKLKNLQ